MLWFSLACHGIGFSYIYINFLSLDFCRFGWQQKNTHTNVDDWNRNPHRKWLEGSSSASLRFNNEGYFKCDFKGLKTEITTHFESVLLNFRSNWPENHCTNKHHHRHRCRRRYYHTHTWVHFKNYPPTIKYIDACGVQNEYGKRRPFLDLLDFQQCFRTKKLYMYNHWQ